MSGWSAPRHASKDIQGSEWQGLIQVSDLSLNLCERAVSSIMTSTTVPYTLSLREKYAV